MVFTLLLGAHLLGTHMAGAHVAGAVVAGHAAAAHMATIQSILSGHVSTYAAAKHALIEYAQEKINEAVARALVQELCQLNGLSATASINAVEHILAAMEDGDYDEEATVCIAEVLEVVEAEKEREQSGSHHRYSVDMGFASSGGERPRVGQRVRIASTSGEHKHAGRIGTLVEDDYSSQPFKVEVDGDTNW